ncbi:MAG: hypothetical protein ACC641_10035 [Acidiferrobacterales bacterium]
MTQPGDNKNDGLEEYLSGDSGLSRTYRQQTKEEPSNAMDETLRTAARRELGAGPRHIINPFGRHWAVPASLAAVFLLSIGLVMFLSDETGLSNLQNEVAEDSLTGREITPSVGAPSYDSVAPASTAGPADRLQRRKQVTKKQPAPSSQPVDSRKRTETDELKPMKLKSRVKQDAQGFTSDEVKPKKPEEKTSDTMVPVLKMEMDAPAESTVLAPELWLQKIENLRKLGKVKEADTSLAQFRKVYPDYPLDSLYK